MTRLWIEKRLKEVKKRKGDLGRALNLPPSRISDMIRGKRRVQSHEIPNLSAFLEMDMGVILNYIHQENHTENSEEDARVEQIAVIGTLKVSGKRYDLWPVGEHYIITLPTQTSFKGINKFALEERKGPAYLYKLHICVKETDLSPPLKPGLMKIMYSATAKKAENIFASKSVESANENDHRKCAHSGCDTVAIVIGRYQQL